MWGIEKDLPVLDSDLVVQVQEKGWKEKWSKMNLGVDGGVTGAESAHWEGWKAFPMSERQMLHVTIPTFLVYFFSLHCLLLMLSFYPFSWNTLHLNTASLLTHCVMIFLLFHNLFLLVFSHRTHILFGICWYDYVSLLLVVHSFHSCLLVL